MSIEKLHILSSILKKHQSVLEFNDTRVISKSNSEQLKKDCEAKGITTSPVGKEIQLNIKNFIDLQVIYYTQLSQRFEVEYLEKEYVVINLNGDFIYHKENKTFENSPNAEHEFITKCKNIHYYYKLHQFLSSDKFSDHYNDANCEIVIYNSATGIFKIKYDQTPTIENYDYTLLINKFIEYATRTDLKPFVKNALYTWSNNTGIIILNEIINKAEEILAIADRDHLLVSQQFNFEKIRNSLYKEKEKFFGNIREVLNKIFAQSIGIPISITAVVFSTYKVSDDNVLLLLVLLSFVAYTLIYLKIQVIYKADILEIKNNFEADFAIIQDKSGLDPSIIDIEKKKIETKINNTISICSWLIWIIIFLGLLVVVFVPYEALISKLPWLFM